MNILEWLGNQGYDYTWNVKLNGSTPDIIAFNGEKIIVFEIRRHADEISQAVERCLQHIKKSSRVYIALPLDEAKSVNALQSSILEKHGIGLVGIDDEIEVFVEARDFGPVKHSTIQRLRKKSLTGREMKNRSKAGMIKEEIRAMLEKHPEGMTTQNLSDITGRTRVTIAKYILELEQDGAVCTRKVGVAKLHYLKEFVKNFGKVIG